MRALTKSELEVIAGGVNTVSQGRDGLDEVGVTGSRISSLGLTYGSLNCMNWDAAVNGGFATQDAQLQAYRDWLNAGCPAIEGQNTDQSNPDSDQLAEVTVETRTERVNHTWQLPQLSFNADEWLLQYGGWIQSLQEPSTNAYDAAAAAGINIKTGTLGANISELSEIIIEQFPVIRDAFRCVAGLNGYVPTITSGNDSKNLNNSLHYQNLAIDLRANDMTLEQAKAVVGLLTLNLPAGFQVMFEQFSDPVNNHIHIEWDPDGK